MPFSSVFRSWHPVQVPCPLRNLPQSSQMEWVYFLYPFKSHCLNLDNRCGSLLLIAHFVFELTRLWATKKKGPFFFFSAYLVRAPWFTNDRCLRNTCLTELTEMELKSYSRKNSKSFWKRFSKKINNLNWFNIFWYYYLGIFTNANC